MSDLRSVLEKLAADFVAAAVSAIQHASLVDIAVSGARTNAAPAPRADRAPKTTAVARHGRRRRTTEDIGKVMAEIAALLVKHAGGLRAEQIRDQLGLPRKELPKPLAEGLASGTFRKRGQKRATVYFVGSGSSAPAKKAKPKAHRAAKAKPKPRAKPVRSAAPRKAKAKRTAAEGTKHPTPAVTNGAAKTATPAA